MAYIRFEIKNTTVKAHILTALVFIGSFISCTSSSKKSDAQLPGRDRSITPEVSYSTLFLDSMIIEKFITAQRYKDSLATKLRWFYDQRNYEYAWFGNFAVNEEMYHVIKNDFEKFDSGLLRK